MSEGVSHGSRGRGPAGGGGGGLDGCSGILLIGLDGNLFEEDVC